MPNTSTLVDQIEKGVYDEAFAQLYGPQAIVLEKQRIRYANAVKRFVEIYGNAPAVQLYSAPGRTEIGGNHTDHNNGRVFAAAVNLDIIAVVAKNNDHFARVHSEGFSIQDTVDLTYLEPVPLEYGKSAALIRGVAAGIKQRGGSVGGFDAYTTSDVLRGSGLSSSAAFEVCTAAILNGEYNKGRFTPVEMGQIGQYAENNFFGKPSGLMDQTASAVGGAITIDFAAPQNPQVHKIPFPLERFGHKLVVTDTKGSHALLTDEYAAIRQEMERVAAFFGKKVLREVDETAFCQAIPALRQKTGDRAVLRAIHFFAECRRVGLLEKAVEEGDFRAFLRLILESGHSSFEYNQNAYSNKNVQEQGVSLGLAISQSVLLGQGAWRLQGGGFAGTIQAFVPEDMLQAYSAALRGVFGADACYILSVRKFGAVQVAPDMGAL